MNSIALKILTLVMSTIYIFAGLLFFMTDFMLDIIPQKEWRIIFGFVLTAYGILRFMYLFRKLRSKE